MRRKIPYRVCHCMPNGVVTHLETRLLKDLVNRTIHQICCAESCKRKYQKGVLIGDLCVETGHLWWALRIWRFTATHIESKDYDDWRYVSFDNNRVRLSDVISETEYEDLLRRCSELWRKLGHPECTRWNDRDEYLASRYFGTSYYFLYAEKYDGYYDEPIGDWENDMLFYKAEQETMKLFRDGQGDDVLSVIWDADQAA